MSKLEIPTFEADGLKVLPQLDDDKRLRISMSGSATSYRPDGLRGYLRKLHAEGLRLSVDEVAVDMKDLEFMNSAGFSTLIDWLVSLQEEEEGKRYKVRFVSSKEHQWQRRSLNALKCLAVDLVTVEV